MFSNIIPCCKKCFNQSHNYYVQVKNHYVYSVRITLQYTLGSQLVRKQSPTFVPGTLQRLTFPAHAVGLLLRVFDVSSVQPQPIGVRFIPEAISTCFDVTGQSVETSSLVEVPC